MGMKNTEQSNLLRNAVKNMINKSNKQQIRLSKQFSRLALSLLIVLNLACKDLTVFAEDITENSKIKLQAILTPPYIIGPGDQITVTDRTLRDLFGQVEKYDLVVSSDGYISIPLPDGTQQNLLAAGLTLEELSNDVRELFSKTLRNPLVFLQISRYRPINVYIGGAVVKPGVYKVETTTTQEGGKTSASTLNTFGLSLTQAIQLAGGVRARGDIKNITVTKGVSVTKKIIDLKEIITGNDPSQDINLQPGDTVFVPFTDNIENQAQTHVLLLGKLAYQEIPVNIVGEVKKSGSYLLSNDSTLVDAIGNAGGLNEVGTMKKIRLSRFDSTGIYRTDEINIHDILEKGISFDEIAIRPNDTIEFVPSKGKEFRHFFRDVGNVLISSIIGIAGSYIVQDNLLNRLKRGSNARLNNSGLGSSIPSITIFNTPTSTNSE